MADRPAGQRVCSVRCAGVALALIALLALATSAAAAGADTIKISLPRHIKVGKPLSIKVSGFASEPARTAQIDLGGSKRKCRSTFEAEQKLPDFGIFTPQFVHGHFSQRFHVAFPESTHGRQYFCAYLTVPTSQSSETVRTTAHTSQRYRIPS